MRKTESEMTADDFRDWCVRHKFMADGDMIAVAVRRGAPEALKISRRQFYDYLGGHAAIPDRSRSYATFTTGTPNTRACAKRRSMNCEFDR